MINDSKHHKFEADVILEMCQKTAKCLGTIKGVVTCYSEN